MLSNPAILFEMTWQHMTTGEFGTCYTVLGRDYHFEQPSGVNIYYPDYHNMKSVMGGEKHCCLVQLALNWLQG
jgi:hypothetical protein